MFFIVTLLNDNIVLCLQRIFRHFVCFILGTYGFIGCIMEIYVFISLGILSSWLIWFIFLLHYGLTVDKSFNFIIMSGKQLIKYWGFIIIMFGMSIYIFIIRLSRSDTRIDVYKLLETLKPTLIVLPPADLILLSIVALMFTIFSFLALKWIYVKLREHLLALYLYYYQFDFFRKISYAQVSFTTDFMLYLIRRVRIFTHNQKVVKVASIIWPRFFYELEPRIFRIIIPYLTIFDIITQDGLIHKVFTILPWYYIYTIIRSAYNLLHAYDNEANIDISSAVYKHAIIAGKSYRWVEIPEIFMRPIFEDERFNQR